MGLRRLFSCYSEPVEFAVPDSSNPLPTHTTQADTERQRALERQLTDSCGGTPYIVPRDAAFLVNIMCDRQCGAADDSPDIRNRPKSAPKPTASFKRLSSMTHRAASTPAAVYPVSVYSGYPAITPVQQHQQQCQQQHPYYIQQQYQHQHCQQQQQQQYQQQQYLQQHCQQQQYQHQHCQQQQHQQQQFAVPSAAVPVHGRGIPDMMNWTESRKLLEAGLVVEQAMSQIQAYPDYLTEHQRLQQRLARLNLVVLVADGDGNCLFRSVSEQLYGTQDYHPFVRQRAVDHIRSHPDEYEPFLGEDYCYYVTGMAQLGTWGDELMLRAICDSFGVEVHVVTSEQHNWYLRYQPLCRQSNLEVFLTYIAPIHYNSLRRQKTLGRSLPIHLPTLSGR